MQTIRNVADELESVLHSIRSPSLFPTGFLHTRPWRWTGTLTNQGFTTLPLVRPPPSPCLQHPGVFRRSSLVVRIPPPARPSAAAAAAACHGRGNERVKKHGRSIHPPLAGPPTGRQTLFYVLVLQPEGHQLRRGAGAWPPPRGGQGRSVRVQLWRDVTMYSQL